MAQMPNVRFLVHNDDQNAVNNVENLCLGGRFSSKFEHQTQPSPRVLPDFEFTLSGLVNGIGIWSATQKEYADLETRLQYQLEQAVEAIHWADQLIKAQGWNPFEEELPTDNRIKKAKRKFLKADAQALRQNQELARERAKVYEINGLYTVVTMYSDLRHATRVAYDFTDFGPVNYVIVYNRHFQGIENNNKVTIGANKFVAETARPALCRQVQVNREQAHDLYVNTGGMLYMPNFMNLDTILAAMMAADLEFKPHPLLVDYVESVILGSFASRSDSELPSLDEIQPLLQEIEEAKGKWGGPNGTILGSPMGEATSIRNIETILDVMAKCKAFSVAPGHERKAKLLNS